jgi:hypothetical protein
VMCVAMLLDCAVVFGTELLLEVLALALAGDEDGDDDDEMSAATTMMTGISILGSIYFLPLKCLVAGSS